jgi:hypothetical protein
MRQSAAHILTETIRTTAQASRLIRSDAGQGHVHPATVLRWILDGIQVGDTRVRLEAVRVGSRWLTSEEALQRFADQITLGRVGNARPTTTSDPTLQTA